MKVKFTLRLAVLVTAGVVLGASGAYASAQVDGIVVDGHLNTDWGVDYNNLYASSQGVWYEEDSNAYYVEPGYGGEDYDVEAMYGGIDITGGTSIFAAMITGFDLEGEGVNYVGDLFIDFGLDNTWDLAFDLSSQVGGSIAVYGALGGFTDAQIIAPGGEAGVPGYPQSSPFELDTTGLTALGTGQFAYSADEAGTNNNVYEFGLNMAGYSATWLDELFVNTGGQGFRIHWTMSCGNDAGDLEVPPVPAPPAVALGLLGLGLVGVVRRRKNRS